MDRKYELISGYCRIESNDMNIIDDIISIIFEYQKHATWSKDHKGDIIELSEDDSKATCIGSRETGLLPSQYEGNSVRADFGIDRGDIISWELEFYIIGKPCNFFGVVTSEVEDFSQYPYKNMNNAYGLDDGPDYIYTGTAGEKYIDWKKPGFPLSTPFKVKITADWTDKQCKLIFWYNGEKLNKKIEDYSMLLPEFDKDVILYPCATPFNAGSYCIIRYA